MKALYHYTIMLCTAVLLMSVPKDIHAQFSDLDPEDSRRFSISVNGGYLMPFEGDRGLFLPNYDAQEVDGAFHFGGNIKYAFTPFWDFGLEYRYMNLEGQNPDFVTMPDFETEVHSIGITNQLNMNRLYRSLDISETLNPYLSLGIGIDAFTYENLETGDETSDEVPYVRPGIGLAVSLSESLDLYGQYDWHFGDTQVDGFRRNRDHSLSTHATAGIRVHFGSSGEAKYRNAPSTRFLNLDQYESLLEVEDKADEFDQMADRLDRQEDEINELRDELMQRNQELEEEVRERREKTDELQERVRELEEKVEELEDMDRVEVIEEYEEEDIVHELELEPGHYIQLRATQDVNAALDYRNELVSELEGYIDTPAAKLLITERLDQTIYEVRIGVYDEYQEAVSVFNDIEHMIPEDSFIVTFPRPEHLHEHYYDIDVADELEE